MTKNEFINRIKRRIDRNRALPITLNNDEIEDIIIDAKNWFYDNYNDACHEFITIIPNSLFQTAHFQKERWIEFEDCIYSIYEFIENKHVFTLSGATILDSQRTIINTMHYTHSYDVTTYVANMAYESVLQNLNDNYISFSWDKNRRRAYVLGHTPKHDVIIKGYRKVPETALFEDDLFRMYVEGQSRIAIGEILSTFDFPLPGGVSIAADTYTSRGESMIDEVKETITDLIKPDWFMIF